MTTNSTEYKSNAYNSAKLQYVMKLIDLKLQAHDLKDLMQTHLFMTGELEHADQLFQAIIDDIVFITVGAPGLRYWQYTASPNSAPVVWASTLDEIDARAGLSYCDSAHPTITEIDQEEFQKLRRSEWAQLSTTDRDIQSPKEFEALYGQNPTPTEETPNGNKT